MLDQIHIVMVNAMDVKVSKCSDPFHSVPCAICFFFSSLYFISSNRREVEGNQFSSMKVLHGFDKIRLLFSEVLLVIVYVCVTHVSCPFRLYAHERARSCLFRFTKHAIHSSVGRYVWLSLCLGMCVCYKTYACFPILFVFVIATSIYPITDTHTCTHFDVCQLLCAMWSQNKRKLACWLMLVNVERETFHVPLVYSSAFFSLAARSACLFLCLSVPFSRHFKIIYTVLLCFALLCYNIISNQYQFHRNL